MNGWRFIAQRLTGDGSSGDFLDYDLPLQDPQITENLTGDNGLNGTISPRVARLVAADGAPLLQEWGTAIWAEHQGHIRGGGIVTHSSFDGPQWQIECTGFTGYLTGMPYTDAWYGVEIDPLDVVRQVWDHVQSKPGGNLGLEVSDLKTGLKIGEKLKQVEFDTHSGPVSFESGPVKLAWYQTSDLGQTVSDLASSTPFDWRERHYWDGDNIRHKLDFGYPRLGRRREDLRLVIGENVTQIPSIDRNGDDYATEALVLGAGQGNTMQRGEAFTPVRSGLRRVAVVTDKSLRSKRACIAAAQGELAWRSDLDDITELYVKDTPHAPVAGIDLGDEVLVQGPTGWRDLDMWCRVTSKTIAPLDPSGVQLTVVRSNRVR